MKFITSINGTVALHVSGDDVMPTRGIFPQDLINFIGSAYNFSVRPQLTPALAPFAQPLVFQSGILTTANDKLPIIQLASVINGDMITAATTEIADLILDDYIARLDSELGYRFSSAKQRRTYLSNIVIQFEGGIETFKAIGKIEAILNDAIPRPMMPFNIKRLAFGHGNVAPTQNVTLDTMDSIDFLLERRANEPYSENRYYSAAPTTTSKHIEIMEVIERALK